MKKILSLLAALMICALCILPAMAADSTAQAPDNGTQIADTAAAQPDNAGETLADGVVQEDDMVIDLNLTTTLIIVICSVLTVAVIAAVVILARKNRS